MKTIFNRVVGFLLVLAALLGLTISLAGLRTVWMVKPTLSKGIVDGVGLVVSSLETTGQGLEVTQQALASSVESISDMQSTLEATADTMSSLQPLLDEIQKLMAEEIPDTVAAAQQALATAQQSAGVIETVLHTISAIPLVGIPYAPEVSLQEALGEVVKSMEGLPDKLHDIQDELEKTGDDLEVMQADLETVAAAVEEIESSMAQYKKVIEDYKASLDLLKDRLDTIVKNAPQIIDALGWALTAFLAWMAIANLGLLTQGWELLTRKLPPKEEEAEKEPKK